MLFRSAFNNTTKALYYVNCPEETHVDLQKCRVHTIKGQNGDLGIVVLKGYTFQTWYSVRSVPGDHVWSPHREIDLSKLFLLDTSLPYNGTCVQKILCTCEDTETLVIRMKEGVFQLSVNNYQ